MLITHPYLNFFPCNGDMSFNNCINISLQEDPKGLFLEGGGEHWAELAMDQSMGIDGKMPTLCYPLFLAGKVHATMVNFQNKKSKLIN